jgi:hypothetical protein
MRATHAQVLTTSLLQYRRRGVQERLIRGEPNLILAKDLHFEGHWTGNRTETVSANALVV